MGFYGLYTLVRDLNSGGSASGALAHARSVIALERWFGVFHEASLQRLVVGDRPFMRFWDGYYGTVHFVAVIVVLVGLFARHPAHYRRWRNTLAATTGLALVGFWCFPVLPPRLLPASFGFDDTLATIGGLWDFRSGAVDSISNQYAAMPSLHCAWALWCACALWAIVPQHRRRPLLLAYPAATIFCVVVTANHYLADAVAGVATVGCGYLITRGGEQLASRWRLHRAAEAVLASAPAAARRA